MSSTKTARRQSQKNTRNKISAAMSADLSPDSKCPICLDTFSNISYLDLCLHKFCFRCIHEWSKNKAECPLCKQPFNSIYHSIKSEQEFKKYDLQPLENGSFGTFGGARFRYRTTLTGVQRQTQRRTSTPPDSGVMFEGSANPPQQRRDRSLRHMMMTLAARRRAASEGRVVRRVTETEMINFRRELYRQGVRVRSVRDGGRSRDTTAEFYRRNPACLHRLVPWLKRELMVLYGAHGSLVNIVQHIIMSRITRYDMEDGAMEEELRPFLQGRAEHFLHEFISFAKSPFNMEAYDQHAVYDCPAPSSNEDSSSNSSVIAISEDEQNSVELDPPGNSMSALSHSAWDDETPGPSYSTTEESRVQRLSVPDSDSDSSVEEEPHECQASPQHRSPYNQTDSFQVKNDECLSSDNDDCVIVGFVKPTAERTPELVQLSSDSENSDHEETLEVPQLPQHIRFTSLSPPTSPSRAPSGAGRSESREGECHHSGSKERYSPSTLRHKPSSKSDRRTRDCHERDSRRYHSGDRSKKRHGSRNRDRKRRRSRSQECSRSPVTLSRSRRRSRSRSRDRSYSRWDSDDKRRDYGFSRNSQLYSYHLQSYNCHGQERDDSRAHYTEKRSYYFSCHKNSDRRSYSRSRSRSGECHRKSRRHSRSRTDSSSCSPSTRRRSHHDKPAGKRKYKTRHLEETANSSPYKSYPGPDSSTSLTKEHKKSKEKHHKKSKEKSRRRSRSLSVEIVYEDSSSKHSKRHHKKKKKHKKKSKRHKSKERTGRQSPTVITIDSDGDYFVDDSITQASSANKDNSINNTADNLADSTHLDSVVQAGNQISTAVAGKDVSEMDLVPDDHHGLLS
ncbi:topoisomerase I binding, arginine/serine-rich a [Myripristis murdjan]|uniref:topoisomerase I binding, arginine/serine-rich a n=1 Tax=Myripristis murdjan TaxID=586833 RepID=UPI00117637C0|nr:E3 ubiquitin-protein ligase Topors-like [Myripristis murdjan]